MARKIMRLIVLLLCSLSSYSQSHKPLDIGDSMPSFTFNSVFNTPGATLSLDDYQGRLIILDFWNVWCGSCIEAFPKMERLQKEFGDKLKVILVTNNSNVEIKNLFKRIKSPDLTILTNDSILNTIFPHVSVPHHVWIGTDGRIQFITDGYNATSENISKILEGKELKLHLKKETMDIDEESDLWKEGRGRLQKYITNYSFAMKKIDEIGSTYYSFTRDTLNKTCRFKFVNIPILSLYKIAFGGSIIYEDKDFAYDNRVQFCLKDGDKVFKYPINTDSIPNWEERNLVCYESKWEEINDRLAYQYLQKDLNRFYPFSVEVEKKEVSCYILKKALNFKSTKFQRAKSFDYTDTLFHLQNMPVSVLTESLNRLQLFYSAPVIDETNCSSNIDITLINAFTNITILKTQLLKNGLLLEKGKRKMKMLIIRNKQKKKPVI